MEISLLWFSLLTRSIIVAAEFSTLYEERDVLYERTRLNKKTIYFDVVLFDWVIQCKKIKNLKITTQRQDIDT